MGVWAALRSARVASICWQDRCRRLRLLRGHAGGGPGRVQRAQAVCHRLQVRGLSREHVQPAGRLLVAPLPALLLPLEHGQSRLSLQHGAGCRELQVDRRADLGQPRVDRVDGRAGGDLRTQRAQECRDLRGLRGYFRHRDHGPWRRRRGGVRLYPLLRPRRAGDDAEEQQEHVRAPAGHCRDHTHHGTHPPQRSLRWTLPRLVATAAQRPGRYFGNSNVVTKRSPQSGPPSGFSA